MWAFLFYAVENYKYIPELYTARKNEIHCLPVLPLVFALSSAPKYIIYFVWISQYVDLLNSSQFLKTLAISFHA